MTMSETPSHFVAVCPNCLVSLKVRLVYSGSLVRCKHCEYKFQAFAPDHPVTPTSEEYQAGPLTTPGSEGERIDVLCPNCSAALRVRKELAGQHVRCKQCDHKFLVQKIEEVPAQIGHADSESDAERDRGRLVHQQLGDELDERVAQHTQALNAAQARSDELAEQLRQRDSELAAQRDELERLAVLRHADAAESERLRDALARREQELQQESDNLRGQVAELHRKLASAEHAHGDQSSRLDEQLPLAREELDSARSEIAALQSRLGELVDRHDQLKADHLDASDAQRARLQAEFQVQLEAQRAGLAEQIAELQARADANAQLVERLKADHLDASDALRARVEAEFQTQLEAQRAGLAEQIAELQARDDANAQLAERLKADHLEASDAQRAGLEAEFQAQLEAQRAGHAEQIADLQARDDANAQLVERLKADHLDASEALQARLQAELEAQRERHAEQIAELQARAEGNARLVERLKAEILTIAQSRSAPDADLAAAREEIADLRAKLAETEITKRSMSSLLEGMGIRLH